jgi:uncharacterized protein (DUF2062 family)
MSATGATGKELQKRPSLWSRIRTQILQPELSRERVAWSFAIGLAIAFNPLIGTHTWIALFCCLLVKQFHRPILLTASLINNPWTMIPIASLSVLFGNWMVGRGWSIDFSDIPWESLGIGNFSSRQGFETMLLTLKPVLVPYLLGGFTLSLLAMPIGYFFMFWLREKLRVKTMEE